MKKVISCFLVMMMFFSIGCMSVGAAATGKLSVAAVTGKPGDTVNVAIKMDVNPGIVGMKISVQYDSSLTLTGVSNGVIFPEDGMTPGGDLTMNPYNVLWCKPTETKNYTSTGTLVTMTFKIANNASAGEKSIRLSCDADSTFNKDLVLVPFSTTNGSVTVESQSDPGTPSIQVSQNNVSVTVGESAKITYTTIPANQSVSLSIGALSHISVQMQGSVITIIGKSIGTDTFNLTMTVNGVKYTQTITVTVANGQPHTHTYTSTVTTEPTCSTDGETTYTCSICGNTYTEPIPATGEHADADNDGYCDACEEMMQGGQHCKYCGKIHGGLFGWLVKFFHSILAIFKR